MTSLAVVNSTERWQPQDRNPKSKQTKKNEIGGKKRRKKQWYRFVQSQ